MHWAMLLNANSIIISHIIVVCLFSDNECTNAKPSETFQSDSTTHGKNVGRVNRSVFRHGMWNVFFLFLFCNKVELFVFLSQTNNVYFRLMFILMHSREGKINTSPPPTTKRKPKTKYPWKKATLCTSCRTRSTTRNGCMVTWLEMKLSVWCLHVFCTRNRMKITWMKTVRNVC